MRYLTLSADYGDLSLRDEAVGAVDLVSLGLAGDLLGDLQAWNSRYQPIIPMDMEERQFDGAAGLIDELDELGLALAGRLADALGGGAKVKYYSEGRLRYLP